MKKVIGYILMSIPIMIVSALIINDMGVIVLLKAYSIALGVLGCLVLGSYLVSRG